MVKSTRLKEQLNGKTPVRHVKPACNSLLLSSSSKY